jgi:aspartyl-tRNA(Asn)/glutamyl-tRNA(Gln) amidotransferase subunit B
LEIHIQLKTKSKMFCRCDNGGENMPINSCVCEICLGHPGTLPAPNKTAIEWAIKASLALTCKINTESKFDRKHYFYPDLPKGYQISQYDEPFGKNGFLEIDQQKIRINRLHLEEDAAKLLHPEGEAHTIVDYNRAGTPLIEVVTEPDIQDPKTAGNFLRELRAIMRVLKISDADMEKGHLRCDANISLREKGSSKFNPKTEIKNLNSFKSVERALAYEIKRQTILFEQKTPPQVESTRGWNEEKGITEEQRIKESANDYRYFPDPDIPPIHISENAKEHTVHTLSFSRSRSRRSNLSYITIFLSEIAKSIPELPLQKKSRFHTQYGLSYSDAALLTRDYHLADYTEKVISELFEWAESMAEETDFDNTKLVKLAANWLINEFVPKISQTWEEILVTAENFAEFIALIAKGTISAKAGQRILSVMIETGKDPSDIMQEENLEQVEESDELTEVVKKVIDENKKVVRDYVAGKKTALKFLMGAVMRETHGRANPQAVEKLIKKLFTILKKTSNIVIAKQE